MTQTFTIDARLKFTFEAKDQAEAERIMNSLTCTIEPVPGRTFLGIEWEELATTDLKGTVEPRPETEAQKRERERIEAENAEMRRRLGQ